MQPRAYSLPAEAEIFAFADGKPVVAEDVVRRRHVKIEVWQREVQEIVPSSRCRLVGADDQDRPVGPFGEQFRAGSPRDLAIAVEARRPIGVRHLARMVG